jgi:hypothetical protein
VRRHRGEKEENKMNLFDDLRKVFERSTQGEWSQWAGSGFPGERITWGITSGKDVERLQKEDKWDGFPRDEQLLGAFYDRPNDQGWAVQTHNRFEDLMETLDVITKAAKRVYSGLEQNIATVPNSGAHEDLKNAFARAAYLSNYRRPVNDKNSVPTAKLLE